MIRWQMQSASDYMTCRNGSVMVELAIAFSVVCVLFFSGVEISRRLNTYEALSSISREGAKSAYLVCRNKIDDPTRSACVLDVYNRISQWAGALSPGADIVLSMYQYRPTAAAGSKFRLVTREGVNPVTFRTIHGQQSKYTATALETELLNGHSANHDDSVTDLKQWIVISEVFFQVRNITPAAFNAVSGASVQYETTMY